MPMMVSQLPLPKLEARKLDPIEILTDDALAQQLGVRVAFTGRSGGVSSGAYEGLNLASHVGDNFADVQRNREIMLCTLGAKGYALVVPNQVHGSEIVSVESDDEERVEAARARAAQGADALIVDTENVAALLCFADCVPVIIVSPTGAFAVVHAGWRGVVASIASNAAVELARRDIARGVFDSESEAAASYNVYIGPHIHAECFETGPDVLWQFEELFGKACIADERHVSLSLALMEDLTRVGIRSQRIADAGVCTVCNKHSFYSYRGEGGICGRHGAIAFRAPHRPEDTPSCRPEDALQCRPETLSLRRPEDVPPSVILRSEATKDPINKGYVREGQ